MLNSINPTTNKTNNTNPKVKIKGLKTQNQPQLIVWVNFKITKTKVNNNTQLPFPKFIKL